jgi:hypothetical protein
MESESRITVSGPAGDVYRLPPDLENARYSGPGPGSVQRTTPGAVRAGTTYRFRERIPPFGQSGPASATYQAIEPNQQTASDFQVGPLRSTGSLLFHQESSATRVTARERMRPPWPARAPAPVLARQARHGFTEDGVEAGRPPGPSRTAPLTGRSPR